MPDRIQAPNQEILAVIAAYPAEAKHKFLLLRRLVYQSANTLGLIDNLVETLKWGEPSYISPCGSTLRIAWKASNANCIAVYFHCKTCLIETIKELYPKLFKIEGNRAIILNLDEPFAEAQLEHCIGLSLSYHQIKSLPLLGAVPV